MDSCSPDIKNMGRDSHRPELGPKNKIIASYLEERSEVRRELAKVQDDVWSNTEATAHFERQRHTADNAGKMLCISFFKMMCKIGDEIEGASGGALSLPRSNARVLDLCMAPGGYTASVLKYSPHAAVCAFTLPRELGGHQVIHRRDERVELKFGDITMLHTEFGVMDIPHDHCEFSEFSSKRWWHGKCFDLVFCDGQALRTHEPHIADYRRQVEAVRLTTSQLILAMQRIESGGTLIILLHGSAAYDTIRILHVFDNIAKIQLLKPISSHRTRGSFYLIAKNVQPGHPVAVAAVNEWKGTWKELTFRTPEQGGQKDPPNVANEPGRAGEVSDLLGKFGERLIELAEPMWQIQKEALATAHWNKKPKEERQLDQVEAGEASSAANKATAAEHHSEQDLNGIGDMDHVDTAFVPEGSSQRDSSKVSADKTTDSAEMQVAMGGLTVDD